ncbi:hypothetical protein Scep_015932 [Stephania cephalantha]|uniref:Uncharacterized protein n=1 Tax=Stephania cephalantha TaxID=152367 RepID=A0AAP0ILM2_9MAGN
MALSRQCIANDSRHDNASLMIQLKMFKGIWFSICQKHLWICDQDLREGPRRGPARTSESEKRARRVTFEDSSRDSGGGDGGGDTTTETRQNRGGGDGGEGTVKRRWWRRGDGESGVGGGRRSIEDGGGAAVAARMVWTVEEGRRRGRWSRREAISETGTVDAGRWRRGRPVRRAHVAILWAVSFPYMGMRRKKRLGSLGHNFCISSAMEPVKLSTRELCRLRTTVLESDSMLET